MDDKQKEARTIYNTLKSADKTNIIEAIDNSIKEIIKIINTSSEKTKKNATELGKNKNGNDYNFMNEISFQDNDDMNLSKNEDTIRTKQLHNYNKSIFSDFSVYDTIGDGSCLIHSFLNSTSKTYRNIKLTLDKMKVGVFFRTKIVSLIYLDELVELIKKLFNIYNITVIELLNADLYKTIEDIDKSANSVFTSNTEKPLDEIFIELLAESINKRFEKNSQAHPVIKMELTSETPSNNGGNLQTDIKDKYNQWKNVKNVNFWLEDTNIQVIANTFKVNILVINLNPPKSDPPDPPHPIYSIFYVGKTAEEMTPEFVATMKDNDSPWIIIYNSI